jgi:hypothetical protein
VSGETEIDNPCHLAVGRSERMPDARSTYSAVTAQPCDSQNGEKAGGTSVEGGPPAWMAAEETPDHFRMDYFANIAQRSLTLKVTLYEPLVAAVGVPVFALVDEFGLSPDDNVALATDHRYRGGRSHCRII